jgi:hypothetical protein
MAQLEKYQIRICYIIADDEWAPSGEIRTLQMSFNSLEESISVTLLMLRVIYLLVVGEERRNEKCSPFLKHQPSLLIKQDGVLTINNNIADGISPVFLIFSPGLMLGCVQQSTPVSQNGITLSEDLSVWHLDNWDVASGIHFRNWPTALVLWPFVESVADIFVCCTGILKRQSVKGLKWKMRVLTMSMRRTACPRPRDWKSK